LFFTSLPQFQDLSCRKDHLKAKYMLPHDAVSDRPGSACVGGCHAAHLGAFISRVHGEPDPLVLVQFLQERLQHRLARGGVDIDDGVLQAVVVALGDGVVIRGHNELTVATLTVLLGLNLVAQHVEVDAELILHVLTDELYLLFDNLACA
jgi:hypothetical protein